MSNDVTDLDFTGVVTEDVSRLVDQFDGKDNLETLIATVSGRYKELCDVAKTLFTQRTLNDAVNQQLDELATTVGITRQGSDDDDLRIRIRAQILINISSGKIPELLAIYEALGFSDFVYREGVYADFNLEILDGVSDESTENRLALILQLAKSAGVRAYLTTRLESDDALFTFDGVAGEGFDEGDFAFASEGAERVESLTPRFEMAMNERTAGDKIQDNANGLLFDVLGSGVVGIAGGLVSGGTFGSRVFLGPTGGSTTPAICYAERAGVTAEERAVFRAGADFTFRVKYMHTGNNQLSTIFRVGGDAGQDLPSDGSQSLFAIQSQSNTGGKLIRVSWEREDSSNVTLNAVAPFDGVTLPNMNNVVTKVDVVIRDDPANAGKREVEIWINDALNSTHSNLDPPGTGHVDTRMQIGASKNTTTDVTSAALLAKIGYIVIEDRALTAAEIPVLPLGAD